MVVGGLPAEWMPLTYSEVARRNGRRTVYAHGLNHSAMPAGAVIASFDLADNPELAGSPVYFAFELQCSAGATLSLMIDPGDGRWQHSNSSKGLDCDRGLGFGCGRHDPSGFVMRSYQATLRESGVARFALALLPPKRVGQGAERGEGGAAFSVHATLSGVAIARVGAQWHSL